MRLTGKTFADFEFSARLARVLTMGLGYPIKPLAF